jgi:hypothetical protein
MELRSDTLDRLIGLKALDAARFIIAMYSGSQNGTSTHSEFIARCPHATQRAAVDAWFQKAAIGGAPSAWGGVLNTPPALMSGRLVEYSHPLSIIRRLQQLQLVRTAPIVAGPTVRTSGTAIGKRCRGATALAAKSEPERVVKFTEANALASRREWHESLLFSVTWQLLLQGRCQTMNIGLLHEAADVLVQGVDVDSKFVADRALQFEEGGQLLFGQKIYLKIEMRAFLSVSGHTVL